MATNPKSVRELVLDQLVEILGAISDAGGYNYDVTPARVFRSSRILPTTPTPCVVVSSSAEESDDKTSGGLIYASMHIAVAFAAPAQSTDALGQSALRFIADIQRALGAAGESLGAAAFQVAVPKYPSGPTDLFTVLWSEESSMHADGDPLPAKVWGQVDFRVTYRRSVFSPYRA